jgi:prepilin-type N-terminal cleavage/methylation domain-containing protein
MRRGVTRGFSLIELLVVIAVIAVLAAILFPVFAQVRERARATVCLSNLKQIGTATLMYAQDYDDTLLWNPPWPGKSAKFASMVAQRSDCIAHPTASFGQLLAPYLGGWAIFHCPSYKGFSWLNIYVGYDARPIIAARAGYGYNDLLMGGMCHPRSLTTLRNSSAEVALFADSEYSYSGQASFFLYPYNAHQAYDGYWRWMEYNPSWGGITFTSSPKRHHGGVHFVYADGHARWGRPSQIPVPDGLRAPWPVDTFGYYPGALLE